MLVEKLSPNTWYLFRVVRMTMQASAKESCVIAILECIKGPAIGQRIGEKFFLTEKAISRLEVACHRAGVERDVKKLSDVSPELFDAMRERKVWALVTKSDWDGREYLKVDGWNFRPENEPPDDAQEAIDYRAQEEMDIAMEGL